MASYETSARSPERKRDLRDVRKYQNDDLDAVEVSSDLVGKVDMPFLILVLILLAIGLVMVLSASYARAYYSGDNPLEYFLRQGLFAILGVAAMLVVSKIKMRTFRKWAMPALLISIVMLALVPIIGVEENGSTRWINLGITNFQPSEIVKLTEILAFSSMICIYKDKMQTFKYGVLPFVIVMGIIVGLLLLEPHLSASIIIIALGVILMFAGGTQARWFVGGGALLAGGGYLVVTQFSHAVSRIETWLDPFANATGDGWQIIQSLYAIGSGGLLGLGLGQSRQKYQYLPYEYNDFIFSVVCEELGYIGAMLILVLFALLIIRGFWLAMHARDRFSSLVATGITSLLALQVFFHVAVATNLVPCTGISLPFFSYGGTALVIQLIEMGIILAISREIPLRKEG